MPTHLSPYAPRIILGDTVTKPHQAFTLSGTPLKSHMLITGTTGSGKSYGIASMGIQLLRQNIAFSLIDPHGDLCKLILKLLITTGFYEDERAYSRLLYCDFSRDDAFVPFNVLAQPYPPHHIANDLLEVYKRAWSSLEDGSAVNLEGILSYGAYVLTVNNYPLPLLSRLLSDTAFRASLLQNVSDPIILAFFHDHFDTWSKGRASTLSESTLRRVRLLSFNPALRLSLGQQRNALNFREIMDTKTSVLYNLSGLDEQTRRFLGCLLTIGYENAALSRSHVAEDKRYPHYLFLDEFSQFVSQSGKTFENILTQARKFGLTLHLAAQTLGQTNEIKDSLQNCIHLTYKLGYDDAHTIAPYFVDNSTKEKSLLEQIFHPGHEALVDDGQKRAAWTQLIKNLDRQECLIHLGGKTFQLKSLTIPDLPLASGALSHIEAEYKRRLLTPRDKAEKELAALLSSSFANTALVSARPAPIISITTPRKKSTAGSPITPPAQQPRPSRQRVQVDADNKP